MPINRYYKILWLKSTGTFKEQTGLPLKLTIKKTSSCRKRNTVEQLLQFLFHADTMTTKKSTF